MCKYIITLRQLIILYRNVTTAGVEALLPFFDC